MAKEGKDPSRRGGDWRSYRCPVCGHADGVALSGRESLRIRCSHCDTPLAVEGTSGGERVSVHVAGEGSEEA